MWQEGSGWRLHGTVCSPPLDSPPDGMDFLLGRLASTGRELVVVVDREDSLGVATVTTYTQKPAKEAAKEVKGRRKVAPFTCNR